MIDGYELKGLKQPLIEDSFLERIFQREKKRIEIRKKLNRVLNVQD